MTTIIGAEGGEKIELRLPQGETRTFDLFHVDDETGRVVDHSQSTANMAIQSKKGHWQLDECVTCGAESIRVNIPASITKELPAGEHNCDLFVTNAQGSRTRLLFGKAKVYDTYAMDGE